MATNEIIALALVVGIVGLIAIYEGMVLRILKSKLHEARHNAASWKALYHSVEEERDLLHRRLVSRDCQKVLAVQTRLEAELATAYEEIDRLRSLSETYKKQIGRKKSAASGSTNTESCK